VFVHIIKISFNVLLLEGTTYSIISAVDIKNRKCKFANSDKSVSIDEMCVDVKTVTDKNI